MNGLIIRYLLAIQMVDVIKYLQLKWVPPDFLSSILSWMQEIVFHWEHSSLVPSSHFIVKYLSTVLAHGNGYHERHLISSISQVRLLIF